MSDKWEDDLDDDFDEDAEEDAKNSVLQQLHVIEDSLAELNGHEAEGILDVKEGIDVTRAPLLARRAELVNKLPAFWATVLMNHGVMAELLRADEVECLQSLTAIEVRALRTDDVVGFAIHFQFEDNEYFENRMLTKTFYEHWSVSACSNPKYGTFSTHTPITWKEGRDILMEADKDGSEVDRQSGKYNSLFEWFVDDSECTLKHAVTAAFTTDIWVNPLQYFLGPLDDEDVDQYEDYAGDDMSR